ncbi:MAG: S-methyl-5-thioribose-1-phosphate isomerase, partial [Opitutaceae bacterium]
MTPVALRWSGDAAGTLELLDQTLLPGRVSWLACRDVPVVIEAIRSLRVRGAPAIGIAGAYGTVLAAAEATRLQLAPAPAPALAHVQA